MRFLWAAVMLSGCLALDRIRDNPNGGGIAPDTTCAGAVHDPSAPVVFFVDLDSGPASGGENNLGPFITLYGLRFGSDRGVSTVHIGGVEVARYVAWNPADGVAGGRRFARGLERIVVQPGSAVKGGDVVVSVAGAASNAVSYTVRAGRIFLVDATTAVGGDGSFAHPFSDLYAARQSGIRAGDIVYVKGGAFDHIDPYAGVPNHQTNFVLRADNAQTGVAGFPIAYVGYPGAPPTIGGTSTGGVSDHAIWIDDTTLSHYTFANLDFANTTDALPLVSGGHRVIGNHFTTTTTSVSSFNDPVDDVRLWGNLVNGGLVSLYGLVTHADVGWNELTTSIAFASYGLTNASDALSVHDNLLDHPGFSALMFGDVNLSFSAYNNIVIAATDGVEVNATDTPSPSRTVQNNTFYQCHIHMTTSGPAARVLIENDIVESDPYYDAPPDSVGFTADHNLYFGAAAGSFVPDASPLFANPLFSAASSGDLSLTPGSPAIDAGVRTSHCADYFGVSRPQGDGWDLGAVEFVGGAKN